MKCWFRLHDWDGSWGFYLSIYERDGRATGLYLDLRPARSTCWRWAVAWRVPEYGPYTFALHKDSIGFYVD